MVTRGEGVKANGEKGEGVKNWDLFGDILFIWTLWVEFFIPLRGKQKNKEFVAFD